MGRGRHGFPLPAVNITRGSVKRFHFNKEAAEKIIGNKRFVEYFYDSDKKRVGFKFLDKYVPGAFKITPTIVGGVLRKVASAGGFVTSFGLGDILDGLVVRTFLLCQDGDDKDLYFCNLGGSNEESVGGVKEDSGGVY